MPFLTVDDRMTADRALRLIRRGHTLLWTGDFQNARQILAALGRRVPAPRDGSFADQRRRQAERVRILSSLFVPMTGHRVTLRRSPDLRTACREAGVPHDAGPVPLRELLGVIGAHQLRRRGVHVPALNDRIHPHYGVFAPTRSEYADLVAQQPLPAGAGTAFDIGTGTGLLAAILARRGIRRLVATDNNPRAVACARENLERLAVSAEVLETDLFPPGRADLIVCNPPWIPATPLTALDRAVYDEDGRMLRGFLGTVRERLEPGGEAWLILSDLAELLGLRSRGELVAMFQAGGLRVAGRTSVEPRHRRARDGEVTDLWQLRPGGC
ncbi:methyltransferase [Kribbella sp. NPDC026611]|uniref:methyltransferase n=1 Tax=Kribbella sp. NPDC026611 TaxID=3154911 RepID=UPI0033DEA884